jgi:hypothetical protein
MSSARNSRSRKAGANILRWIRLRTSNKIDAMAIPRPLPACLIVRRGGIYLSSLGGRSASPIAVSALPRHLAYLGCLPYRPAPVFAFEVRPLPSVRQDKTRCLCKQVFRDILRPSLCRGIFHISFYWFRRKRRCVAV